MRKSNYVVSGEHALPFGSSEFVLVTEDVISADNRTSPCSPPLFIDRLMKVF